MNLTTWFVKCLAFLCFLALAVTGSKSQDSAAARILSIQGSVKIMRPDSANTMLKAVELVTNDAIYPGDVIKTGSGGRVVLKLKDNSQAIISENAIVEIKDTNNSPRTIFNVLRGKTRIKIEKMGGKPNPYQVTTPTTVIAVRGTVFDVFVKDNKTEVFVTEGEVSVTSIAASQEVILKPGNFTQVKGNQPPQPPAVFTPQQNDKFFNPKGDGQGASDPNNKSNKPQNGGNSPSGSNPQGRESGNPPNQPPKQPNNPGNPNQGGEPPRKP